MPSPPSTIRVYALGWFVAVMLGMIPCSSLCGAQEQSPQEASNDVANDDKSSEAATYPIRLQVLQKIDIAAKREGFLKDASLVPGTVVTKGQVVARLYSEKKELEAKRVQAEIDALTAEASNSAGLTKAQQDLQLSQMRSRELNAAASRTRIPRLEIMEAQTSVESNMSALQGAFSEMNQAQHRLTAKRAELEIIELDIKQSAIRAPFDGIVFKQFKHSGEAVSAADPIAEVYRLDRLLGSVLLRQTQVAPAAFNDLTGTVRIEIPNLGVREFEFEHPSHLPRVERDGRFLAVVKIWNRKSEGSDTWILLPGMQGKLVPMLNSKQASSEQ